MQIGGACAHASVAGRQPETPFKNGGIAVPDDIDIEVKCFVVDVAIQADTAARPIQPSGYYASVGGMGPRAAEARTGGSADSGAITGANAFADGTCANGSAVCIDPSHRKPSSPSPCACPQNHPRSLALAQNTAATFALMALNSAARERDSSQLRRWPEYSGEGHRQRRP